MKNLKKPIQVIPCNVHNFVEKHQCESCSFYNGEYEGGVICLYSELKCYSPTVITSGGKFYAQIPIKEGEEKNSCDKCFLNMKLSNGDVICSVKDFEDKCMFGHIWKEVELEIKEVKNE